MNFCRNLSNNRLDRVQREMFELLRNLISLDVSMNLVAVLKDSAFREISTLETL